MNNLKIYAQSDLQQTSNDYRMSFASHNSLFCANNHSWADIMRDSKGRFVKGHSFTHKLKGTYKIS